MSVKHIVKRDKRADATRSALLAAARRLFASRGFPDVSVDEIVQGARVTKGALYHHFKDKREIFGAVVREIEHEILERLESAAARPNAEMEKLRAACGAYLDACVEDEVGRIVVLDSPVVLGWEAFCKLEREYGRGFFVDRLRAVKGDRAFVEPLAQMILGALNVAGRVIAQSADRHQARRQVAETIDRLLASMAG